jgi:formate hydrogenlyase subunit 3/multisubunit Na+/H+ antiporter MnhD subunit
MSPLDHLLIMLTTPLAPFVMALAFLARPRSNLLRYAAIGAPLPALLTSMLMPQGAGATLPWLLEGSELGLDPVGRVFLFFSATIWAIAAAYAAATIALPGRGRFFVFFMLAMSGNLGLIVARDMLSFYLFFSLMSFSAYGLVVHAGTQAARRAGAFYITLVVAGDMMLYAALVPAALDAGGTVLLTAVRESIATSAHRDMILTLVIAGFGVKAGALGLHFALPLVYRAAPIPAAAALAGAMLHAGLLGWLRFLPLGADLPGWGNLLIALGIAGAFYGAIVGSLQRAPQVILAYSSISQIGIMLAGLGAALKAPEIAALVAAALAIYAAHHAFVKNALLLGVGIVARRPGSAGQRRILRAALVVLAIALPGAPLTSGMLAKEYLKEAIKSADEQWATVLGDLLPWTAVATTLIVARFLWIIWPHTGRAGAPGHGGPRLARAAWVAAVALALSAVWAQPVSSPPELWSFHTIWAVTWPVLLGAALAFAAAAAASRRGGARIAIPPGDLGVAVAHGTATALAAWGRWISGALPAARDALQERSTAALRHRRWGALAASIEETLAHFGIATALFVFITIVLAAWALAAG